MAARLTRRLPGFKFEARSPQLDETLPRMDIAVFVGFAASGPLDTPVAIEEARQFAEVFGSDAPLAWDAERCRPVYAQLGSTVRSFFRNGGRRCWVIRVASHGAAYNYFAIPGLALAELDRNGRVASLSPAFARARSEGSWSDPLSSSSALLSERFDVVSVFRATGSIEGFPKDSLAVELRGSADEIVKGDLLRLTFDDGNGKTPLIAMVVVEAIADAPGSTPADRRTLVGGTREVWLRRAGQDQSLASTMGSARVYVRAPVIGDQPSPFPAGDEFDAEINWPAAFTSPPLTPREELEVFLRTSMENAPAAGTVVPLSDGDGVSLMTVSESRPGESATFGRAVRVLGQGLRVLSEGPAQPAEGTVIGEKLSFELWVRRGSEETTRLTELGLNSPHPKFWGDLPTDKQLYSQAVYGQPAGAIEPGRVALAFERQRSELTEAGERRFPLAGLAPANAICFPVGMSALPHNYLPRLETTRPPLERDGLSRFDASLFLDPEMIEAGTSALSEQADFLRYLSPRSRQLRGLHAAFGIEEATIIAVPDAIHRGWTKAAEVPPPVAEQSSPIARPEWWHFRDCKSKEPVPLVPAPERGHFLSCDLDAPDAPSLRLSAEPDSTGSFTLEWSVGSPPASPPSGARFILEESARPNFSDAIAVYEGGKEDYAIYGRSAGEYFYRVRVELDCKTSNWSNGVGVRVSEPRGYGLNIENAFSSQALLAVHRALLRMCAARGDLFGVLSLPEHYREDEAESYIAALKSSTGSAIEFKATFNVEFEGRVETRTVTAVSLPLGGGETADFSYGAVYHPWLIGGERDRFRPTPPDGAACGVIAARALTRGAWIAPANVAMSGAVALTPSIRSERRLDLQEAQINIIRQDPRGFMSMSADTLSDDEDLRPINVRRLLSLLRRLALRLGARYVFEPNDASFRRAVGRGFEALLGQMFARGAFAGITPQTSFQVVTGGSVNPAESVERGRFIVELRVAPSLPMTFMTVRLVQTGDRSFVVEAR